MASKKSILPGAAALGLLFLFAGRKEAEIIAFDNAAMESAACARFGYFEDKFPTFDGMPGLPSEFDGRTHPAPNTWATRLNWATWIAYRLSYPGGPLEPPPAAAAAIERLRSCISAKWPLES